mmetsp:Transcript_13559/g.20343  ORF Transcript_13559/g.20343 Transcript_13559/m.20343 type:complete len:111 (+) Transcript_13559:1116-1448(+)
MMADSGMTDIQMQNITGHKSTTALKKYVANSTVQKNIAGAAIAIDKPTTALDLVVPGNFIKKTTAETNISGIKRQRSEENDVNVYNISIHVTGGTNVNLSNLCSFGRTDA